MSPDLELRVLIADLDRGRARRIAHATQVEGALPVHPGGIFRLSHSFGLQSGAVPDLLADSADWPAETWDMVASELPRLVRTLAILFAQVPEEFAIEVIWAGDKHIEELTVSREAMLDIVSQGRIGTHTRYRIRAA